MVASTHQIRQGPQVRALALAAVLMLLGVVVVLMAQLIDANPLLLVIGLVVIGFGFALLGGVAWVTRAARVRVVLDEDGYAIEGRGTTETGKWSDVGRVTRGNDRITLHHKDGTRVQLVVARSASADLDALGADIAQHLDADRGYGG